MNVTEVTTIAGCVAGLGVIALIASGWRQPARVERSSPRGLTTWVRRQVEGVLRRPTTDDVVSSAGALRGVESLEPVVDPSAVMPTPWWKRARSVAAGTGLALWMGAVAATVVGFAAAFVVVSLTSMLRR